MNVVSIIAVVSAVWFVLWKLVVLDTIPDNLWDTHPIKYLIAVVIGGPFLWLIAVIYFTCCMIKRVAFMFIIPLRRIAVKFWEA